VQELKSRIAIADLVGRYVPLRQSGERRVARCPFHDDQKPSFVVFPATGTFHCFGCGAHGDVIAFLMRVEQVSFKEALDVLRSLSR
jgi:DNA primase